MMKLNRKGFTLVEIMIVVAIIALLAAIAIPNLLTARKSANDSAAQATLKGMATACETYAATYGVYPAAASYLATGFYPTTIAGTKGGYTYSATDGTDLTTGGYTITADASSDVANNDYRVATGGILSRRSASSTGTFTTF